MIKSEAHSDDHVVSVKFDAAPWFAQASDAEIVELAECGFGGDYPADEVAEHFSDSACKMLFDYLALDPRMGKDDPVGFECHVDPEHVVAWVENHRPHLAGKVLLGVLTNSNFWRADD